MCACKFCGCVGVETYHLLGGMWANCGQQLHVNRDSIGQIIKVLHACKLCCAYYFIT